MNDLVKNKKVLITGASNGIGLYLAIHAARQGAEPIIVSRSKNKLRVIKEKIEQYFDTPVHCYQADLSNDSSWKEALNLIYERHGEVDALINNAGMGRFQNFVDSDWEDIDQMININVKAVFRTIYECLPYFIHQKRGHIINIGSQAGKMATPKSAVYSATKHAVLGFSNALRMEVENSGVYVTTVNLGPVKTNFFKTADPSGNYQKSVDKIMLDPNTVALEIINHLFYRRREINLPSWMNAGSWCYQLSPGLMEALLKSQFHKK
ncbi:SDR family NAD(P)-dependent oxidoreductase [Halobacillus sp. A5]|uniref:SDR family NAD(P)-dependent oxidoreductase n=1 Tax=Halobacillus sp. A5 TaxID=2880263 RepID=UPI0020A65307|nr:SDR family oxidoreductase [Halobacillus sp. A5]